MSSEIFEYLKRIKFIGAFPHGILVLLVSNSIAVQELRISLNLDITEAKLRSILKEHNVSTFSNLEDWDKYRGRDGKR